MKKDLKEVVHALQLNNDAQEEDAEDARDTDQPREDGEKVDPDRAAPETMGEAIGLIQEDVQAIRQIMENDTEDKRDLPEDADGPKQGGDEPPDVKEGKKEVSGIMAGLKSFFGLVKKFLLMGVLLVAPLLSANEGLFSALKELFNNLFNMFKEIVGVVMTTLVPAITQILTVIIDLINDLMPSIMGAFETLMPAIQSIVEIIVAAVSMVVEALLPIIQTLIEILTPIIQLVANIFIMTLTAALPLIEGAGALLMFVLDAFILVFNGALEFIARIADFFGKGDSVRQFKIQKDTSADAANDIDFSQDEESVAAQIKAKEDSGEINSKTADKLREDSEKFREKQAQKREKMIQNIGATRVADIPDALKSDGEQIQLVKMDLGEVGLGEVFVDPNIKEDGSYNMYKDDGTPINYRMFEIGTGQGKVISPMITAALEGLDAEEASAADASADFGSLAQAFGGDTISADSLDTADAQQDAAAGGAGGSGGNVTAAASVNTNQNVNQTTQNFSSGGSNPTGGRGNYFVNNPA